MDKTFNFFKNKPSPSPNHHKHPSPNTNTNPKSQPRNQSRNQPQKNNQIPHANPISKKQKEIREAIEYRFQRSKMRAYNFEHIKQQGRKKSKSSQGEQIQEYKNLKKMRIVDLRQYHKRQDPSLNSSNSSQEKSKFNIRLKLKDQGSGTMIKTQGHSSLQKSPYINQILKSMTPSKTKSNERWKFISIQIKQDTSKHKHKKLDLKISSHRSYILPTDKSVKTKSNSSTGKYMDKVPRLKDLTKLKKAPSFD